MKQYLDSVPSETILSKLTDPLNRYNYLKISSADECGGRNNPFELLSVRNKEQLPITNSIYTKELYLDKECGAQISNKARLQIQNKISSSPFCLKQAQKLIKQSVNNKNSCLLVLLEEGKEVTSFYENHCKVTTEYASKYNSLYKIIVKNDITIIKEGEIFIQHLIISDKCKIKLKNCKLNITDSITVSDEQVQENFDKYSSNKLLGINVEHDIIDV